MKALALCFALAGPGWTRVVEVPAPPVTVSPLAIAVAPVPPGVAGAALDAPALSLPAPAPRAEAPRTLWRQAREGAARWAGGLAQAVSRRTGGLAVAAERNPDRELAWLFDGEVKQLPGLWVAAPAPEPEIATAVSGLSPSLAAALERVGSLDEAERRRVIGELARAPIRVRGPPAFPAGHTFSLELEFQVHRQLDDAALAEVFAAAPLTSSERARWRAKRELSPARWEEARAWVARRALQAAPAGWRLKGDPRGSHNTLEFNTGGDNGEFHVNTAAEWSELLEGLARVDEALPGGLYGLHVHNGLASRASSDGLQVDGDRFARLMKVYEAYWRALSGLGYREPRQPKTGMTGQIEYLPWDALEPGYGDGLVRDHGIAINLHPDFPTIENRLLSGLLRRDRSGRERLDGGRLAAELWWAFALARAAAGTDAFELATLGVPVAAGMRPSQKQILAFADRVYGQDVVGKALAIKKLLERYGEDEGLGDGALAEAEAEASRAFRRLGLGVVYDLHAAADGYDERLLERLEASPGRLSALARDLSLAHGDPAVALSLFPPEFRPVLARELAESPRPAWRRALAAVRRYF